VRCENPAGYEAELTIVIFINKGNPIVHECTEQTQYGFMSGPVDHRLEFRPSRDGQHKNSVEPKETDLV